MIRHYVFWLVAIAILANVPKAAFGETCLRDFLTNEKWVSHPLSRANLKEAAALARQSGVARGWEFLAKFGDTYAGLASMVTRKGGASPAFGKMVHRHWQTVVGAEKEKLYFDKVAAQHFGQYLRILETGTWPDSNQILLSYLTSVRTHGLPDELVFDAAWLSSRYRAILDWRAFNILPLRRWAVSARVCLQIDPSKADAIIAIDFGFPETFKDPEWETQSAVD